MSLERHEILLAARACYQGFCASNSTYSHDDDNRDASKKTNDLTEMMLKRELERATERLADFLQGKAYAMALDQILPGWFDLDLSLHLPKNLQRSFVSNDPNEWYAWLLEQQIDHEIAFHLVNSDLPKVWQPELLTRQVDKDVRWTKKSEP